MKVEEILNKVWDVVVGFESEIEDGYLVLESNTMSEEDYKEALEDVKKAIKNYEVVDAFITPAIDGRDNGSWSDGNIEIVEEWEVVTVEELEFMNEEEKREAEMNKYVFYKHQLTPISALKLDLKYGNAYDLVKEALERLGYNYCGVSVDAEIYIPLGRNEEVMRLHEP